MPNSTNMSYLNSLLLANIRSLYIKDALNLFILIPLGVIGTILNLITLIILSKKTFSNKNIYNIMKLYTFTSLIITFFIIFVFYHSPKILFELSKIGRIYICNLAVWFYLFFFFFGNCLDILMNLERALNYTNGYDKIKQISSNLIFSIVFVLCLIIHLPNDLALTYTPDDQLYIKLYLCHSTEFANKPSTKMILFVTFIIEGPIVMILTIVTNILAYISYRSFMKRKKKLLNNIFNRSNELTEIEKRKLAKMEKKNQKLLIMTIYLTIFSIISHFIQFSAQIIIFLPSSNVSLFVFVWAQFIYIFIIALKHFCTIFFNYNFNSNFKRTLLSFFRKKR